MLRQRKKIDYNSFGCSAVITFDLMFDVVFHAKAEMIVFLVSFRGKQETAHFRSHSKWRFYVWNFSRDILFRLNVIQFTLNDFWEMNYSFTKKIWINALCRIVSNCWMGLSSHLNDEYFCFEQARTNAQHTEITALRSQTRWLEWQNVHRKETHT